MHNILTNLAKLFNFIFSKLFRQIFYLKHFKKLFEFSSLLVY